MKYLKIGDKVKLRCSKLGFPRKRIYVVKKGDEETIPFGTVVIEHLCPWHDTNDFETERYFDKEDNELFWKPEDL